MELRFEHGPTRERKKRTHTLSWALALGVGIAIGAALQWYVSGLLRPSVDLAQPRPRLAALPVDPRMPLQLRVTRVILAGPATEASNSQALISVNGEKARPFAIGALVRDGLHVRSVAADRVRITNDDSTVVFDLAVDQPPLPHGSSTGDPAPIEPGMRDVQQQDAGS
jgi:hypothetical protein